MLYESFVSSVNVRARTRSFFIPTREWGVILTALCSSGQLFFSCRGGMQTSCMYADSLRLDRLPVRRTSHLGDDVSPPQDRTSYALHNYQARTTCDVDWVKPCQHGWRHLPANTGVQSTTQGKGGWDKSFCSLRATQCCRCKLCLHNHAMQSKGMSKNRFCHFPFCNT